MKKKPKPKPKSGDDIQIEYERYLDNNYYTMRHLTLKVVALDFQSANDDEWRGTWNGEEIWVKFTRPGHDTIFSDNFPVEHQGAAFDEVRRIERQFN